MTKEKPPEIKSLSKNKKALHDYEVLDKFEAGIVLHGDEVKAMRLGQANLKGSYVEIIHGQAYINEGHVSKYKYSSNPAYDPTRRRKLILHRKEIDRISQTLDQKGFTVIPLELYLKKGLIKVMLGICRGKKLYDKREDLKKRDQKREIDRAIKKYLR